MDNDRKRIARTLKRLKHDLLASDVPAFRSCIEADGSADVLIGCREQKVLMRAAPRVRQAAVEVLREAAPRYLTSSEADRFQAYLDFSVEWSSAHARIAAELRAALQGLSRTSLSQLVDATGTVLRRYFDRLPSVEARPELSVAEYERRLGNANGFANDTYYAVVRAMNEAAKASLDHDAPLLPDARMKRQIRSLERASVVASKLNALEWLFDSVTYGDMDVTRIPGTDPIRFRMEFSDPRLHLLRTLAIRRALILNTHGARARRFVREKLKELEDSFLDKAIGYYVDASGIDRKEIDRDRLKRLSSAQLILVDAEDDLLSVADTKDRSAATYYSTAMALRWYAMTAEAVRTRVPRKPDRVLAARIPLYQIEEAIELGGGKNVAAAIERLLSDLPAKSHYDLARRPFIREVPGIACYIPHGDGGTWNTTVRETLTDGGRRGDAYGRICEEFYIRGFVESDWKITGRNVHLRRDGRIITEVDILLRRGDLLLVTQVKALIGSGMTVYDHWRNKQTVVWGCRQARVAADFIQKNKDWLASVVGNGAADEIRYVQPVVLTTVDMFNGWSYEGVPVIAEGGRKAITEGAKVRYTSSQTGETLYTQHFSTSKILWALENPLELMISPESMDIRHRETSVGGLFVAMPDFELRTDLPSYPRVLESMALEEAVPSPRSVPSRSPHG
ncbi:hypothetical protein JQ597_25245 [Bradyrhizobium sp. AUGA SZCCT0177]|uniref:hypothetical protein n=1 Tax=Bradyrhizobium sp. AUGA SZCCT0177 TaxID=2807665 RepID=UPI001BAA1F07|nr:hypothetical protein [Bradyrhizobium sp. AUGA SZCCT0177]MBR1285360.1 hypothetical protein [Bradyrhizobium sp. AUGA SZCCT0177]